MATFVGIVAIFVRIVVTLQSRGIETGFKVNNMRRKIMRPSKGGSCVAMSLALGDRCRLIYSCKWRCRFLKCA